MKVDCKLFARFVCYLCEDEYSFLQGRSEEVGCFLKNFSCLLKNFFKK